MDFWPVVYALSADSEADLPRKQIDDLPQIDTFKFSIQASPL